MQALCENKNIYLVKSLCILVQISNTKRKQTKKKNLVFENSIWDNRVSYVVGIYNIYNILSWKSVWQWGKSGTLS